ncbi:MAG: hypothetical protein WC495_05545 [Patescibacteria group bacterium]|jgi:hypothetical protein
MPEVHNHSVDGEHESLEALRQLDPHEAEVLFDYAHRKKSADFEGTIDGHRENFTLIKESDGGFRVDKRGKEKSSGGWFKW